MRDRFPYLLCWRHDGAAVDRADGCLVSGELGNVELFVYAACPPPPRLGNVHGLAQITCEKLLVSRPLRVK